MTKFDGHFCAKYGSDSTHLYLSDKADRFYAEASPLNIYERKVDIENFMGKVIGSEFRYAMDGVVTTQDYTRRYNWITAAEVNAMLEELADQFVYDEDGNEVYFDSAAELMDDDIREELHATITPCSNQAFFDEYCKRHLAKYGEPFAVN